MDYHREKDWRKTMFCKKCRTRNEEGSKFCEPCGAKMIALRQVGQTNSSDISGGRRASNDLRTDRRRTAPSPKDSFVLQIIYTMWHN